MEFFPTSQSFSSWAADILSEAGVDKISEWTMLEYWVQVELYRAIQSGKAGKWRHVGEGEPPYFTSFPRGRKIMWCWADLLIAEPDVYSPQRVIWIELKDLGRSPERLLPNARMAGRDLAALVGLDVRKTADGWKSPSLDIMNKGQVSEWKHCEQGLRKAVHFLAQLVIASKDLIKENREKEIVSAWLDTFHNRIKKFSYPTKPDIVRSETDKMAIFAMVMNLGGENISGEKT